MAGCKEHINAAASQGRAPGGADLCGGRVRGRAGAGAGRRSAVAGCTVHITAAAGQGRAAVARIVMEAEYEGGQVQEQRKELMLRSRRWGKEFKEQQQEEVGRAGQVQGAGSPCPGGRAEGAGGQVPEEGQEVRKELEAAKMFAANKVDLLKMQLEQEHKE